MHVKKRMFKRARDGKKQITHLREAKILLKVKEAEKVEATKKTWKSTKKKLERKLRR